MIHRLALLLALLLLPAPAMWATSGALCVEAAAQAARSTGVPAKVLAAIALVETGGSPAGAGGPWPWAMNRAGESRYFDRREDLVAAAEGALAEGARNFDLGCFQINHRWHAGNFASLEAMVDPSENALYAARFLARLHEETGDWAAAAAAYHSRTPEHAERYRARFDAALARLEGGGGAEAGVVAAARVNRFPLLQGGAGRGGSAVPLPDGPARPLVGGG